MYIVHYVAMKKLNKLGYVKIFDFKNGNRDWIWKSRETSQVNDLK